MTLQDRFAPERLIAAASEEVGSDDFVQDLDSPRHSSSISNLR